MARGLPLRLGRGVPGLPRPAQRGRPGGRVRHGGQPGDGGPLAAHQVLRGAARRNAAQHLHGEPVRGAGAVALRGLSELRARPVRVHAPGGPLLRTPAGQADPGDVLGAGCAGRGRGQQHLPLQQRERRAQQLLRGQEPPAAALRGALLPDAVAPQDPQRLPGCLRRQPPGPLLLLPVRGPLRARHGGRHIGLHVAARAPGLHSLHG
mmetsp:Transcript_108112/g.348994  ORF Transcript_108112/g.348994 Transcript_108112/m.348994 type:complete len:207 (+) Transcript_108112:819-1439(+)